MAVLEKFIEESQTPQKRNISEIILCVLLGLTFLGAGVFYYQFVYGQDSFYRDIENKYILWYPCGWDVYGVGKKPVFFKKSLRVDSLLVKFNRDNVCGLTLVSREEGDMDFNDFLNKNLRDKNLSDKIKKIKIGENDFGIMEKGSFKCLECPTDLYADFPLENAEAYVTVNMKNQFYVFYAFSGMNTDQEGCQEEIEKILSALQFYY